jgi:type II secretory pathway component PulK
MIVPVILALVFLITSSCSTMKDYEFTPVRETTDQNYVDRIR